ncbi:MULTISPECIES: carboxypeptidase-like regulatory domain-containing protein [unclassified Capnocytophaga]|jgi:hypothetical protein|uniref:carboxypeptidase-like regulatory domain-containing protein n=1 Tax=unclassified Capnocytophaga TaxID=2640652 RepID=UPI000202E916|nr:MULTISPECIES: carboxypeptidase-like regulatory domain-containing protein [unclassified Capnocytophaga]EGD34210.1 secreted protein [Capnocytophaga sp. oral taxon 338 str. F0234]MEB3004885.1 carboxypeptidase-like regulatory domain-containing protein [Capnocytophaga sp. G2]
MKNIFLIFFFIFFLIGYAQEETIMRGNVFNTKTNLPLDNVNILNINQVRGAVTNIKGDFAIRASVNDTLHFSYLGFKSIKIKVTQDMIKFPGTRIGLTELAYALEEVVISPYRLTGYLEIDAKYMPINTNRQYSISGLDLGYEPRTREPNVTEKVVGSIFNPAGLLYRAFSGRAKDLRKLKKMKQNDEIRNILNGKYDRETLSEILGIEKDKLEDLLRHCNYSKDFIKNSNDLQFLDALTQCYEEYKLLNK